MSKNIWISYNKDFIEDEEGNECFAHRNGNCFWVKAYDVETNIALLQPMPYCNERMVVVASGLKKDYWEHGYYFDSLDKAVNFYLEKAGYTAIGVTA